MNSYVITRSISLKKKNEDYIEVFENDKINIKGFIMGDGIGSHYRASEGSEFCVKALKKQLEECPTLKSLDITHFYKKVYNELRVVQLYECFSLVLCDGIRSEALWEM